MKDQEFDTIIYQIIGAYVNGEKAHSAAMRRIGAKEMLMFNMFQHRFLYRLLKILQEGDK